VTTKTARTSRRGGLPTVREDGRRGLVSSWGINPRRLGVAGAAALVLAGAAAVASATPARHHRVAPHADPAATPATSPLPRIVRDGDRHALFVDGAPYLILGAQANNSSNWPSQLPKVWPAIEQLHANTVEIPVSWEQIEPKEGQFDFSYLDTLLAQAREHRVHLVLLWFATWKNNGPNYAPEWVKLDNKRFPRVINAAGVTMNSLSPIFPATLEADRKAFATLMAHLKAADPQHTVIMIQPENETGVYGAGRDHSPTAEALFAGPVPDALVKALNKTPGTWTQVFGPDADVSFEAWHVASFVNQVAAAGKAADPLPMYVNAALRDPFKFQDPLTYSSGGPTWNVLDIWKAAAPSIDVLAPDIYMRDGPSYLKTLEQYGRPDNALFVPETGDDVGYARYLFPVLGAHAIGFSPFGLDFTGYTNYPLGAKTVDAPAIAPFASLYAVLNPMAREWAALSFKSRVWGVAQPDKDEKQHLDLGRWDATVSYGEWQFGQKDATWMGPFDHPADSPAKGGVMIAELGPDEFLVIGQRARISFGLPVKGAANGWMYARIEEGHYEAGHWVFERLWNGDQTDYGLNFTDTPTVLRVHLATY
jgi:beta-galactosidase GanA